MLIKAYYSPTMSRRVISSKRLTNKCHIHYNLQKKAFVESNSTIFDRINRTEGVPYLIRPPTESHNLSNNLNDNNSLKVLYKALSAYKIHRRLAHTKKPKITTTHKRILIEDLNPTNN